MQIGFNNDIEYRGKTFHIQTEDRGMDAAQVETQIFQGGAILDTAIIPYDKHVKDLEGDELIGKVRQIMQAAHKNFYKKLHAGEYDELVGLEPLESAKPPDLPEPDEFEPGQDRVPGSAMELEDNPDAFAIEEGMGEAVDLNEIHRKLQQDAKKAEAAKAASESKLDESSLAESDAPTMMVTAEELSAKMDLDARTSAPKPGVLEWPETGVRAWKGCEEPREDLSIVDLVEKFLAS